jgi:hypothetical protein
MAENPRIEELRRRVLADPASIAFAALAEEFRRVGRYEDAIETCRTGLLRHPAYLSARVTLGRALIETGDFEGAREQLETVLRSAPENLAAIRGLAQIHERLGHSTEMDPHLTDIMNTHAESIRVATPTPPEPPPPAEPSEAEIPREPELSLAPQASPDLSLSLQPEPDLSADAEPELSLAPEAEPALESAPEAGISMAPKGGPSAGVEAPADPFADFAQMARPVPAEDFSFDLSSAFSLQPAASRQPDAAVEPDFGAAPVTASEPEPAFAAEAAGEPEAAIEPALEAEPERVEPGRTLEFQRTVEFEPARPVEPEPEVESALQMSEAFPAEIDVPDPAILATLARLERMLGAIHSLRG